MNRKTARAMCRATLRTIGRLVSEVDSCQQNVARDLEVASARRDEGAPLPMDPARWNRRDYEFVRSLLTYADVDALARTTELLTRARLTVGCAREISVSARLLAFPGRWRGFVAARQSVIDIFVDLYPHLPEMHHALQALAAGCRRIVSAPPKSDSRVAQEWRERNAELTALRENLATESPAAPTPAFLPPPALDTHLLPEDLLARIDAIELDLVGLNVRLRRYQDFGARFVLAGGGVILGDEMGLGKTIEAIAVAHHLMRTNGRFAGLVVAPASIMENWRREITRATSIPAVVMHGPDRQDEVALWRSQGGFGITSFQTLQKLEKLSWPQVDLMIVDEAHRVKNPATQQTQAVARCLELADRRLLLTGTPLENRTGEFIILAGMANPSVGASLVDQFGDGSYAHHHDEDFRRAIAPAYLRRNQSEVLTELPEMSVTNEFVEISDWETAAYRRAIRSGDLAQARQAVTVGAGQNSAKIDRLRELLEDYREREEKVLVFSFFLRVLSEVQSCAGPGCHVIHGGVSTARRQEIIDSFVAAPGHGVLTMQIDVGGLGLNLQAASAVVIMEPQWKPSTEVQAIARAHRMGQTRNVQVHRLLAADTIDERIEKLLGTKQAILDAVARPSALAEASDDAVNPSMQASLLQEERDRLPDSE